MNRAHKVSVNWARVPGRITAILRIVCRGQVREKEMGTSAIQRGDVFVDVRVVRQTERLDEHNLEVKPVCKWMNYIPVTERSPIHMATLEDFHPLVPQA
jgi:hypothetical protein